MRKLIFSILILTSAIVNSQNKEIIKETFFKQSIENIETIAIENGYHGGDYIFFMVFFKADSNGNIFDISMNDKSNIFLSEIINIVNQIPKLNPNEYLSKGNEIKYGLKFSIKLSKDNDRKLRLKKGIEKSIVYKYFYVKEYLPVKWITVKDSENNDSLTILKMPISENCKNIIDEKEIRDCVSKDLQMHIAKNFDLDLAQELGLTPGKKTIHVYFVISKTGEIVNIRAEGTHELLLEEAVRVVNTFPKFYKPGFYNGKPVNVKYALPITFLIQQ